MSAYRNPPAGYVYLVFEMPPAGQLRFLTHVARSAKGRKVCVKGKALPHRTTKGALRLVVYLVPHQPTALQLQHLVQELQDAFERTTDGIRKALHPLAGQPIESDTPSQVRELLTDWASRHCARIQIERDGDRLVLQSSPSPSAQTDPHPAG